MPPMTTLVAPPALGEREQARWNGASWDVEARPAPAWLDTYDFPDPKDTMPGFLDYLRRSGDLPYLLEAYHARGITADATECTFMTLVQQGVEQRAADYAEWVEITARSKRERAELEAQIAEMEAQVAAGGGDQA